jgi:hypothetical protein
MGGCNGDTHQIAAGGDAAKLLSDDAPTLVGLSEETTCYVSMAYFKPSGQFDDFVVHEAAHIFHNCNSERVPTTIMIEKEHEKNQSSLPSPVSPVVSQYHRAAKRSELNRQQRRCQPWGNRRPIAVRKVLHTLRSTGPGTSAAVPFRRPTGR